MRADNQAKKGPQVSVHLQIHPTVAEEVDDESAHNVSSGPQSERAEEWIIGDAEQAKAEAKTLPKQDEKEKQSQQPGFDQYLQIDVVGIAVFFHSAHEFV